MDACAYEFKLKDYMEKIRFITLDDQKSIKKEDRGLGDDCLLTADFVIFYESVPLDNISPKIAS